VMVDPLLELDGKAEGDEEEAARRLLQSLLQVNEQVGARLF